MKLLTSLVSAEDIIGGGLKGISKKVREPKKTAEELGVGELTLKDIVQELEKPARDPRDEMPRPVLRSDVLDMKDLTPGWCSRELSAILWISVHLWILVFIRMDWCMYLRCLSALSNIRWMWSK